MVYVLAFAQFLRIRLYGSDRNKQQQQRAVLWFPCKPTAYALILGF